MKMSFEGKCQQEIGKWTEYCLKKENGPRASSAPALELNTIIFKHVYWYMQQISGERLQDHWSSGHFLVLGKFQVKNMAGGGNKNKREEKAKPIKIKDFLIHDTFKICIICYVRTKIKMKFKKPILFSGRA